MTLRISDKKYIYIYIQKAIVLNKNNNAYSCIYNANK